MASGDQPDWLDPGRIAKVLLRGPRRHWATPANTAQGCPRIGRLGVRTPPSALDRNPLGCRGFLRVRAAREPPVNDDHEPSTRLSHVVRAPRPAVYQALLDPQAATFRNQIRASHTQPGHGVDRLAGGIGHATPVGGIRKQHAEAANRVAICVPHHARPRSQPDAHLSPHRIEHGLRVPSRLPSPNSAPPKSRLVRYLLRTIGSCTCYPTRISVRPPA